MAAPEHQTYRNELLGSLGVSDLALIEPHLQACALPVRKMLEQRGKKIQHVYFPEAGMASVVAKAPGMNVEVGVIGREGMTGLMWLLGQGNTHDECFMQMAGDGYQLSVDHLVDAFEQSGTLRVLLLASVGKFLKQVSATAVANALSSITTRTARWLLLCRDRSDSDDILITHEFLGMMLGAHRPGVTVALQKLEGERVIKASRGLVSITDRDGLISIAEQGYTEAR